MLNFESNDAIKYCVLREVIIRVQHRNDRVLLMWFRFLDVMSTQYGRVNIRTVETIIISRQRTRFFYEKLQRDSIVLLFLLNDMLNLWSMEHDWTKCESLENVIGSYSEH